MHHHHHHHHHHLSIIKDDLGHQKGGAKKGERKARLNETSNRCLLKTLKIIGTFLWTFARSSFGPIT